MGLRFESYSFENKTREQVNEWYDAKLEHFLKGNIQFLDYVFDNEAEANDWVSDNTDKWYGPKAVRYIVPEGHTWVVGGWVDY